VHVGGGRAQRVRTIPEVFSACGRVQGDAPGILDTGKELLRERKRAGHCAVRGGQIRPGTLDRADRLRHVGGSRVGQRSLQLDVRIESGMDLPEHLADDRHGAVVGTVDQ
jgi:hypothetical protein